MCDGLGRARFKILSLLKFWFLAGPILFWYPVDILMYIGGIKVEAEGGKR